MEYVRAIQRDVKWLGFDWGEHFYHASDYFDRYLRARTAAHRAARLRLRPSEEEFSKSYRGTITEPGEAGVRLAQREENLDLFPAQMRGEFKDGERCSGPASTCRRRT